MDSADEHTRKNDDTDSDSLSPEMIMPPNVLPLPFTLESGPGRSAKDRFIALFEREHMTTMRVLTAYPSDRLNFRPHERCGSARELAWVLVRGKAMMIKATKAMPSSIATRRLSSDCSMNVAGRKIVVSTVIPGNPGCISRIASSTPRVTSTVFAPRYF